jgi:hypothetical protein
LEFGGGGELGYFSRMHELFFILMRRIIYFIGHY